MSRAYRETYNDGITTPERVKTLTQIRGGERDAYGKLLYVTEQAHIDRCDVNKIIARYRNTGMINIS